eukprot:scaffold74502_cov69-Phaeocystis_antarctica.AAC.1
MAAAKRSALAGWSGVAVRRCGRSAAGRPLAAGTCPRRAAPRTSGKARLAAWRRPVSPRRAVSGARRPARSCEAAACRRASRVRARQHR